MKHAGAALFALLLLTGCASRHQFSPALSEPRKEIQSLRLLPYFGYLQLLETKMPVEDADAEAAAKEELMAYLENGLSKYFAVSRGDSLPDSAYSELRKDVVYIFRQIHLVGKIDEVALPGYFVKILSPDSIRHHLFVYQTGFSRSARALGGEQIKALSSALSSPGRQPAEAPGASSHIKLALYDNQLKRLVFFNQNTLKASPFSSSALYGQVTQLLGPMVSPKKID